MRDEMMANELDTMFKGVVSSGVVVCVHPAGDRVEISHGKQLPPLLAADLKKYKRQLMAAVVEHVDAEIGRYIALLEEHTPDDEEEE